MRNIKRNCILQVTNDRMLSLTLHCLQQTKNEMLPGCCKRFEYICETDFSLNEGFGEI